jgi:O-antigen/teichoic acid export membrane protein
MTPRTPHAGAAPGIRGGPDGQPGDGAHEKEHASYWPRHASRPSVVDPKAQDVHVPARLERRGRHAARGPRVGLTAKEPAPTPPFPGPVLATDAAPRKDFGGPGALRGRPNAASDDVHALASIESRGRHTMRGPQFGLTAEEPARTLPFSDPRAATEAFRKRQLEGLEVLLRLANATAETQPLPLLSSPSGDAEVAASRALGLLKDPAVRAAAALILSNVMAGGLGFVFWAVTAHYQKASGVGAVSAEVSAITFLASVGSLNLINVFARFLPEAGWHARRMILVSYSAAILAGSLGAVIFLLTPLATGLVIGGGIGRLAFALCVVLNSVFMIQDGGLVGFGRSGWVPVENIFVALARLALLPLSVGLLSARIAILSSWALPMAAAVAVVNAIIIGRLASRRRAKKRPSLPPVGQLGRFVAIESVTTAVAAAVSAFLPALVTRRLGATQGGYFYVPWIITTMASLLFTSILISMVREAVARPDKAGFTIRRSLRLVLVMVIAGMLGCVFLARLALAPMGPEFAIHGAPLLGWVGLALPAVAVNLLYWALCLVRRRPWPVLAVNLTTSAVMIGGVILLRHGADISRVGTIYCLAQWTVAVVVALPAIKTLRVMLKPQELL